MDIPMTISAGYAGIKFAKETFQVLLGLKIEGEVREKIVDALARVGATQDALFELREELSRLQTDNERLRQDRKARDDWDVRKAKYSLQRTAGGAIVQASDFEPKHFACPSCFETNLEIQILQDRHVASGRFDCPHCKEHYDVGAPRSIPNERATSSGNAWGDDR